MSKQLSDDQVRAVIVALRNRHVKLMGSTVRAELRRKHGSPGGVSRIYRLLQEAQGSVPCEDQSELVAENTELRAKLAAAIARAELAELREESHQARWGMEVDSLRQQLREVSVDRRQMSALQDQVLSLYRRIHELSAKG